LLTFFGVEGFANAGSKPPAVKGRVPEAVPGREDTEAVSSRLRATKMCQSNKQSDCTGAFLRGVFFVELLAITIEAPFFFLASALCR
jgi:hypothetical protein